MKQRHILAALAAVGLTVSACGGSDDSASTTAAPETTATAETDAPSTTAGTTDTTAAGGTETTAAGGGEAEGNCALGTAEPAAGDLTPVKVVVLPIADVAPVYYGVECGQWAAAGLDVELQVAPSGQKAGEAVATGDADLGVSAWATMATPWLNGQPFMVVVDGAVLPPTGAGLLVGADSEIAAPADLEGKSVAINGRGGSPEVGLRLWAKENGVDFDKLTLVETAPGDMIDALNAGSVDSIIALEPFSTIGQAQGLKPLAPELYAGIMQDGSTGGLMSTKEWADANPETITKVRDGWASIVELFQGDDAALRGYLATYTGIPAEVTAAMTIANFRTTTEVANVQPAIDATAESGVIPETFDVTPFVAP